MKNAVFTQRRDMILKGSKMLGGVALLAHTPLQAFSFASQIPKAVDMAKVIKTKLDNPYFSDICDDISGCEIAYPHYVLRQDRILDAYGLCEAILLGDSVLVTKGGWDKDFNFTHKHIKDEINQAFYNVNTTLQAHGANPINACYVYIDTKEELDSHTYAFVDREIRSYYPKLKQWKYSPNLSTEDDDIRILITIRAMNA